MAGPHTRLYRSRAGAQVAGVCAGLADYYGVGVSWVRWGFIAFIGFTGGAGLFCYPVFVMIMPQADESEEEQARGTLRSKEEDKKFWQQVRKNPRRVAREVRGRLREMDRRLADAEAYLTSPDKRLAREIESLR